MKNLKKLAVRNLLLNKKRATVTIIGIMLSTALICVVAGIVTSFQATFVENAIMDNGDYEAIFKKVDSEEVKYVENNRNVTDSFRTRDLGYAKFITSIEEYRPYLYVSEYDDEAFKHIHVELTEGRLPKNSNEIIIPERMNQDSSVVYKIGDKLTLDIGKRYLGGKEVNQDVTYSGIDGAEETLVSEMTKEYTIVGIFTGIGPSLEPYSAPASTLISYLDDTATNFNIGVLYTNPVQAKEFSKDINDDLSQEYEVIYNEDLLDAYGGNFSSSTMSMFYIVGAIVILIILVSSVFVIKNSFSISITEKFKQYGMLISVGATSKQIKKMVLFEGLILGVIGIALGLILGILVIYVLVLLINLILGDYLNNLEFVYYISPWSLVVALLFSIITIYLSAILPARKAAKISPIETIRGSDDIKINNKKIRSPKLVKKIFGIGGEIAYKNLKRSRKKYRTTVISLVVSIIMFISISALIQYSFKVSNVYYQSLDYNVSVFNTADDSQASYELYKALEQMFDSASIIERTVEIEIPDEYLTSMGKEMSGNVDSYYLMLMSIGDEAYKNYVDKLGGKADDYAKGGILLDNATTFIDDKKYSGHLYNLEVGDEISGTTIDSEDKINIRVVKKTDILPMNLGALHYGVLIVSDSYMDSLDYSSGAFYLKDDSADEAAKKINDYIENNDEYRNVFVSSLDESIRENNAIVLVISIFLYGFITVITLIGVTNIFNTITTNMNLRRKEFAMLKSVGMTSKEFNRMIRLESVFYGFKSLIIGIPLGLLLSYGIYMGISESLETPYVVPIGPIIISIVFVFVIVFITMHYSLSKINKENIIETIRSDNI